MRILNKFHTVTIADILSLYVFHIFVVLYFFLNAIESGIATLTLLIGSNHDIAFICFYE